MYLYLIYGMSVCVCVFVLAIVCYICIYICLPHAQFSSKISHWKLVVALSSPLLCIFSVAVCYNTYHSIFIEKKN